MDNAITIDKKDPFYTVFNDSNTIRFMDMETSKYSLKDIEFLNHIGLSNQNANIVVLSEDMDSIISSGVLCLGSNYNTSIYHYMCTSNINVYEIYRKFFTLPYFKDIVYLVNMNCDNNHMIHAIDEFHEDEYLDVIYVDSNINETFIVDNLPTLWKKMKSHSILIFRNVNQQIIDAVVNFFNRCNYGVPIPINIVNETRGFLAIKKPVIINKT